MNLLDNLISQKIISSIGWTIIHSLWQGALVAVMLAALMVILRKSESRVRSLVSIGAMIIFLALTVRTFVDTYNQAHLNSDADTIVTNEINTDAQQSFADVDVNTVAGTNSLKDNAVYILNEAGNYFREHLTIVVTFWLTGVLLLTLKLIGGYAYTQRLKHHKVFLVSEKWEDIFKTICERLSVTRPVKFAESAIVKAPVAIGYLKPAVLLPLGSLTGLPASQIEAILIHELAHIARADYIINIFQSIIETVFFYHPGVWWISSNIRKERENCCDDVAVEITGDSFTYAKALVNVQAFGDGESGLAMAAFSKNDKLFRRINRMILKQKSTGLGGKLGAASVLIVCLFAATLISCSSLNNDEFGRSYKQIKHLEDIEDFSNYDEGEKKLSFYETEDGVRTHWKVYLDDGDIVKLYKNHRRIPDDELYKYQSKIDDKLESIAEDMEDVKDDLENLDEELVNLKKELADIHIDLDEDDYWDSGSYRQNFRERERSGARARVRVDIDHDNLRESLREIKEELRDIKISFNDYDFRVKFDHDFDFDFDHDFDFDDDFAFEFDDDEIHIDMEELNRSLACLSVDLSDLDIDIDIPDINIDMTELNKELAKLESFLDELREELVDDGYIDDIDDRFELEYDHGKMYINGDRLPDDVCEKYKDIYEDHYDEELDDGAHFHIN